MTNIELDFYYADTEYFGHLPKNKGGQGCRLLEASEKTKVHGNSAHEPIPKGHTYSEQGSENEEAGTVDEQAEKDLGKYEATVGEYKNKRLGNQQTAKPTTYNFNRSQNEVK